MSVNLALVSNGMGMVQVTPLMRTLAPSL